MCGGEPFAFPDAFPETLLRQTAGLKMGGHVVDGVRVVGAGRQCEEVLFVEGTGQDAAVRTGEPHVVAVQFPGQGAAIQDVTHAQDRHRGGNRAVVGGDHQVDPGELLLRDGGWQQQVLRR